MYTLIFLLLAVFCLYIGAWAFVRWDASWLRNMDILPIRLLLILIGVLFLLAALLLLWRFLKQMEEKGLKRTTLLCMGILVLGQLLFLFTIRPMLRYDPLKTFDMAAEMLRTHTISGTYETGYFARYTNNYPLTILTYWFFLLLSKLGIAESLFMPVVQIVNIACITGSIWLGYLIAKECKGRRTAVFYLTLCVLCPLSYVWAGFFYTTTCSMPCLMGILYLSLQISKSRKAYRRILLGGLLGAVLILGYKLRATAMIAMIAVLLAAILKLWKQGRRLNGGFRATLLHLCQAAKPYTGTGIAFLLAVLLSLSFWKAATDRYVAFDYKNTGFPTIHWVMMGSRWDGAFEQLDELYTSGFETKEEKIEADKKVLVERLREAGPVGLISLAGRKLLNTWVDGTDSYRPENSYSRHTKLYDYLLGNKCGFATLYSQAFRTLTMLAIGLMALASLWGLKHRQESSALFLVQLTLLGGMAFHLIWETNPLYSISFTFLGLLLLADGVVCLHDIPMAPVLKKAWMGCSLGFVVLLVLLLFAKKELVETPIEERNYCVDQYQYAGGGEGLVASYDQVYSQTFTTDRPFNRISIRAVNSVGGYNQSAFLVTLTAEDGTVLYDNDRFLSGMVEKNTPYEFVLDPVIPDGAATYRLDITPGYIKGEDSLEFLSYNTGNYDMYPGGSLSIAGEPQEKGDLAFAVYEYKVTTYFSIKAYLAICAGLMILTGALTVGMKLAFGMKRSNR